MRRWLAFLLVGCGVVGLLLSLGRVATVSSDSWTTSGEGPAALACCRERTRAAWAQKFSLGAPQ